MNNSVWIDFFPSEKPAEQKEPKKDEEIAVANEPTDKMPINEFFYNK